MRGKKAALWAGLPMIAVALVLAIGPSRIAANAQNAAAPAQGQAQGAASAVPVEAAPAQVQGVPVFLRGLGTVQAFNTVLIRAQVNGTLISVPVKEGQEVRTGDVIAEIDPRPYKAALDQAIAQRAGDQAQLQSAELDLRRYQSLAKSSFAPVQQVDDQQATVNRFRASIAADTAAIETAEINLGFCTIRAPINGRIGLYQTDIGNLIEVANQAGIVTITQDKPISVVFTLPEATLPRIQAAMAQRALPVLAYAPDDKTELGQGTLLTPNNQIDAGTGTISLKATFDNPDDKLWPGAFVNARLLVETLHDAVTVPPLAVQHGPDGLFVFVVGRDGTVQQRKIAVGYQDAAESVVTDGLNAGETVVTAGQSRLSPGARVAVRPPAQPPQGGARQAANQAAG